jgi:hypothetical protein
MSEREFALFAAKYPLAAKRALARLLDAALKLGCVEAAVRIIEMHILLPR